nr:AI-2E family transporter [Pseudomonas sp. RIT-PI-AD]
MENKTFLILLILVTLAFLWILLPFYGAVFWAVILAVIFTPMQRRISQRLRTQRNASALITLSICLVVAILPVIFISIVMVQQAADLYQGIESGEINLGQYVAQVKGMLPSYLQHQLDRFGMSNFNGMRDKAVSGAMAGGQVLAKQMMTFGQNTFDFIVSFFIMLYLLYFFLRDGPELVRKIRMAIPLAEHQKRRLQLKFTRVVRATVKGNLVVAITQGALGGFIFWALDIPSALLWGVLMAFLSLLPAVGSGLVWAPVAVYFFATGALWQGIVLALFGVFVIGLVDNVLRPLLVGKDTKMPDYLVLISTLGGMAIFGLNGFVVGPLVAALFMSTWALFTEKKPVIQLPR